MIPVARSEKLLIQSVGNEVIVYDEVNNSSHCLNPVAARVWHYCDGQHSVKDIAKLLEKELQISPTEDVDIRGLVWLTLEELERYQLIKEYLKQPTGITHISRRKVVKTGSIVGGFAIGSMFPLIRSVAVAAPGDSQSPGGVGNPTPEPTPTPTPCPPSALRTGTVSGAFSMINTIRSQALTALRAECARYCAPCNSTTTADPSTTSCLTDNNNPPQEVTCTLNGICRCS